MGLQPNTFQGRIQNFSWERVSIPRGRLPNILVIFSEKRYEIKEILVCRGGACRVCPLNLQLLSDYQFNSFPTELSHYLVVCESH